MDAKTLSALWASPDNSRLTAKQQSFRLPVHVAAKLAALCELYPNKTRTQLVGDLLSAALADMQKGLPSFKGAYFDMDENGEKLYEATGPLAQYRVRANKHFEELEKELGNEAPEPLFPHIFLVREDGE